MKKNTLAKNNLNIEKLSASHSCKRSTRLLLLQTIHTKHSGPHGEGRALIPEQPKCSLKQNLRDMSKPAQLTVTCRSTDRLFQKPNQPRLLSTSKNSWHSISNAIWQLRATFATSQSCRKREILSPDPCSPMTKNASLPTFFSLELLDKTEEPLSDCQEFSSSIMCKPTKAHAFTASTGMLGPNRTSSLMTIGSFFIRKKKSSPYGHTFLGHSDAWRLRAAAHCPKRPEKATGPLPTTVASDLTPPCCWSLLPCFHKASSQL